MRNLSISLAAMALLVAGCQKPELDGPVMTESSFMASVETFCSQTKTSLGPDNRILWSSDDRIAVFYGRTLADEYVIDESCVGKSNATFNSVAGEGNSLAGSELPCNVAFYPYADDLSLNGSETSYEVVYSLPPVQHYAADSFSNGAFPMMAVTKTTADHGLQFKNVLGAMKLSLKGTQVVKSIKVEGNNGEKLSGAATLIAYANNLNPVITLTGTDESSNSVTLDCGEGVQLNTSTATDFILALPPVLFKKGFTVTVTDSNSESHTVTTGLANTVLRSSILVMPEFVMGEFSGGEYAGAGRIKIDGDFSDWEDLDSSKVAVAECADNAKHTALKVVKVYANSLFVNVYLEFDESQLGDMSYVPLDIFVNQEGKNGVADYYFVGQTGVDWLLEAPIISEGACISYDPGMFQYTGSREAWEWDWTVVFDAGIGISTGAGASGKYEFAILREMLAGVELADTFGIAFILSAPSWASVGVLPNADVTDENPEGIAPMLMVNTDCSAIVALDNESIKLYEGGRAQLDATVYSTVEAHKTIVWSSENPTIATVDQTGLVTAVSEGTTTIYAVAGGSSATCSLTVNPIPTVDYIDEYGINHGRGTAIGMTVWAPVNCGYHATDYQWGKLYQWGRRYGQGYDGDATTPELAQGGVSLVGGNHSTNSNVFYWGVVDWVYPGDNTLWNTGTEDSPIKTKYDPCPEGWRVPTLSELRELCKNHSEWTTNEAGQLGYWFSGTSSYTEAVSRVFFPAAGYRYYNNGNANNRGDDGYYWSSWPDDGGGACHLSFYDGSAYMAKFYSCAVGCSVRCVHNSSGEPIQDDDDDLIVPVVDVILNHTFINFYEDGECQLTAKLMPVDAVEQTVVWRSENPDVATVDQSGLVKAMTVGTTTISAVVGDLVASCSVTVVVKDLAEATADYVDEYGVNHGKGTPVGQVVWAPVNCGYHATDYKWGKLYQWGRKYGQGYSGDLYDYKDNIIGDVSDATTPVLVEERVSVVEGNDESNSNKFYYGSPNWADPYDNTLWNAGSESSPVKTEYDPCPEGWRVPTFNELSVLCQNYSNWEQSGYWFSGAIVYSETAPQVFFPAACARDYYEGISSDRGHVGRYWSSLFAVHSEYYARSLFFINGYVRLGTDSRADGYSVRCVQE